MENTSFTGRQMTYGEKAVGLDFNPSANDSVSTIKALYANIIDRLSNEILELNSTTDSEKIRLLKIAITEAQGAQMWAVKSITWKY